MNSEGWSLKSSRVTTALTPGSFAAARDVDRPDARVRVRAAQDRADQQAGHGEVGAEPGAAGHLVDAVGADRARADDLNSEPGASLTFSCMVRLLSSRRRRRAPRGRSCRSRCSGTGCRPASSAPRSRSGSGIARAAPWRRPGSPACRCRTAARRAPGTCAAAGCSSSPSAMPSMVSIDLPLGLDAEHQARAHQPAVDRDAAGAAVAGGQPSLVPVRPSWSRRTSSSVSCVSHRNSTASPLTVAVT